MLARLRHALPFVVGLALFMAALEVLRIELRTVSWPEIVGEVLRTPASQLAAAIVLTILNYTALTGYDLLAFACIRKPLPRAHILLASKAILFNDSRTAFIMYGVEARTWVALGDPVGPEAELSGLVRAFLERCDDFGGVPVFYEVGKGRLHLYADFGLTFVKLGEEAKVDLTAFTLEGGHASRHRRAIRRLEKDGGSFRVIEAADVPGVLSQLRAVSDDWLHAKASAEKGFSLGFFDESYLVRFPVGVIERHGRIEAFANIWPGPGGQEVSIDLMRYHRDAAKGVMEALFVHLMIWGRDRGYGMFGLGMAPLSGFQDSPVASLWNRLGSFVYEHADAVYNFQRLRLYKDKFDPVWEPRYLASPGGLRLPRIMADVSALVAGGYRHIFRK